MDTQDQNQHLHIDSLFRADKKEKAKTIEQVKAEMNRINRQKLDLEDQVKKLDATILEMKKTADALNKENIRLELTLENERNRNVGLSKELEDVRRVENERKAEMDQVVKLTAEVTGMVKHLEAKLDNMESLVSCIQTREIQLGMALAAKQREVEQVTSKKDELEKRFIESNEKLEMEQSRVADLHEALEKYGSELVEGTKHNVALEDACTKMEMQLGNAQRDITNLQENSENMKSELRRAKAQVKDALEEKDNLKLEFEQKVKQLEEERSSLSGRLELNETLNAELKERCSQLEVILGQQETTFREFQNEFEGDLKGISTELRDLNNNLKPILARNEGGCESQDESMFLPIYFFVSIFSFVFCVWMFYELSAPNILSPFIEQFFV